MVAFSLACLGEFIRNLGYQALQCGSDTALSIPLAIDAGLSVLGKNEIYEIFLILQVRGHISIFDLNRID